MLLNLWRSLDDPNNTFFLFSIDSPDRAKAFISAPDVDGAAEAAGVLDGDIVYVESNEMYQS